MIMLFIITVVVGFREVEKSHTTTPLNRHLRLKQPFRLEKFIRKKFDYLIEETFISNKKVCG